jgi:trimeric autotransporter adhesin
MKAAVCACASLMTCLLAATLNAQSLQVTASTLANGVQSSTFPVSSGQRVSFIDNSGQNFAYVYYNLKNAGSQTLTITAPVGDYNCENHVWSCGVLPASIAAGQTVTVTETFGGTADVPGANNGSVSFTTNDPSHSSFSLVFQGIVGGAPVMTITSGDGINITAQTQPYTYLYPTTPVGVAFGRGFTFDDGNPTIPLLISNYTLTNNVGSCFSLIAGSFPNTITNGNDQTYRWRMDSAALGSCQATISFTTNDPNFPTFSWNLQGTVADIGVVAGDGTVIANGGVYVFPTTPAGTPESRGFTITNYTATTLTIYDPSSMVSASPAFSQTVAAPGTIAGASGTGAFRVRLLSSTRGNYSATVTIQSSDPYQGTFTFTVMGAVN